MELLVLRKLGKLWVVGGSAVIRKKDVNGNGVVAVSMELERLLYKTFNFCHLEVNKLGCYKLAQLVL